MLKNLLFRGVKRAGLGLLLTALSLSLWAAEQALVQYFNAEGYRVELMRSPVGIDVEGASTIDDPEQLERLLESEQPPLLIDVLPLLWRGIFIETAPHLNIPGSHWLPNVGQGELEPVWNRYLQLNLERLTEGDLNRALVFYCKADCWHSWNAAKRALALGYQSVYWYPLGVEGWLESGLDLAPGEPVQMTAPE